MYPGVTIPPHFSAFLLILVSFKGSSIMFLDVFMILVSCKGFCKILSTIYFLILVSCKGFYRILSRHTTWFLFLVKVCRDVAFSCQGELRCYVYPLFLANFFVEDFFIYGFSRLFLKFHYNWYPGAWENCKSDFVKNAQYPHYYYKFIQDKHINDPMEFCTRSFEHLSSSWEPD